MAKVRRSARWSRTRAPYHVSHLRKAVPIRLPQKNRECRCKFNEDVAITYTGLGSRSGPFHVSSLFLAEVRRGRAGTHSTNENFISRGKSFIHHGIRTNPQFVGHIRVTVLDGVDDKVLIISCLHRLQIRFLIGVEDESGEELNHL